MAFYDAVERVFAYAAFSSDIYGYLILNNFKEDKSEQTKMNQSQRKILDNKKFASVKEQRRDGVFIVVGLLFIGSVVGFVAYGQYGPRGTMQSLTTSTSDRHMDHVLSVNDIPNETTDSSTKFEMSDSFQPFSYKAFITPDFQASSYLARVTIHVKCLQESSVLGLNSSHIFGKVTIQDNDNKIDVNGFSRGNGIVMIFLKNKVPVGHQFSIVMSVRGGITEESSGMFLRKYQDGKGSERKLMIGLGNARHVFPYFVNTLFRASYQIILFHNEADSVISNMAVAKTVRLGNSMAETHFEKSPSLRPEEVVFVIADFTPKEIITSDKLKVRIFAPKGRIRETYDAEVIIPALIKYYQTEYGANISPKLDIIPVNMLSSLTPGILILPEHILLLDGKGKTPDHVEKSILTLAQAVAKQQFGCLNELGSKDNIWLTESLVIYLGYQAVNYLYPSWDVETQFYLDVINKALKADESKYSVSLSDSSFTFSEMRYKYYKGAALLNMISKYSGTSKFHESIKLFCDNILRQKQLGKNVTVNLMDILTEKIPQVDMKSWVVQPGFPLVSLKLSGSSGHYIVHQEPFLPTLHPFYWQIPMLARSMCDKSTRGWLLQRKEKVMLADCYLQKLNYGGSGFYRTNYILQDWRNFSVLLNKDHSKLPTVDRVSLIADAFEITWFNPRSITVALHLTKYLDKEHHYGPYKIALTYLREIANLFSGTEIEKHMKKYIEKKTRPVLYYLNSLPFHNHMQKKLIGLLMRDAASYDDMITMNLQNKFFQWMIDSSNYQPPTPLRVLAFEIGILKGSIYEWNYFFQYFLKVPSGGEEKENTLNGLSASKNKLFLKQLLDYANRCNISLVTCMKEKLKIWTKVCENNDVGRELVKEAFFKSWKDVLMADKILNHVETFMLRCLGSGKTEAESDQLASLDTKPLPSFSKTLLAKVIEVIQRRISFISQAKRHIGRWLVTHL